MQAHVFSRIDSVILLVSLPPLVRGVDWHDRVGQKSQGFVSGCPISTCIPGDRDEVLHRSSSKKDGTLCPVSYSSALDHLRWSMEWWITRWIRWIWLKDSLWWRCWCLGIGSQRECRVTRRNGNMGCRLATVAKIGFSIMKGSRC